MHFILGTAQLASRYGIMAKEGLSQTRAIAVLEASRRLGILTLDTAPSYEGAEAAIGAAGAGFAIHTKLPPGVEPAEALATSLHRLRRDRVEVLHLHDPEMVLDPDNPRLAAAAALVGDGTDSLGSSVYTRKQFLAAVKDPRITVVQAPMNVLDTGISDDDLHMAARSGTIVIARSALLQGLLGDPAQAIGRVPELDQALSSFRTICERVGRAPVELAISWVRSRPGVAGIILGAETPEQLQGLADVFVAPPLTYEEAKLLTDLPKLANGAVDPRAWCRP